MATPLTKGSITSYRRTPEPGASSTEPDWTNLSPVELLAQQVTALRSTLERQAERLAEADRYRNAFARLVDMLGAAGMGGGTIEARAEERVTQLLEMETTVNASTGGDWSRVLVLIGCVDNIASALGSSASIRAAMSPDAPSREIEMVIEGWTDRIRMLTDADLGDAKRTRAELDHALMVLDSITGALTNAAPPALLQKYPDPVERAEAALRALIAAEEHKGGCAVCSGDCQSPDVCTARVKVCGDCNGSGERCPHCNAARPTLVGVLGGPMKLACCGRDWEWNGRMATCDACGGAGALIIKEG